MRRIPENVINDIRQKSDIVDTVSSYISLTKKGKNYWGLCPFHDDSDPSMSVSPDRQIYKCFVCGAGGNVFGFIENFEKVSFVEAVIKQASRVNIDLGEYRFTGAKPIDTRRQKLVDLMTEVQNFTEYQLTTKDGIAAMDILKNRGYSMEVLKHFGVGVALGGNQIHSFLQSKGYSDDEMLRADIIRYTDASVQDVFYNRIMFPIFDQHGAVIAFSARAMEKDNKVKYINTSETELYIKGEHIYNLHNAKEAARKAGFLIMTEGVTDAFAFTMAKMDNVVSLLGVACTERQLKLIRTTTQNVVLAFDGDKAGIEATYAIGQKLIVAQLNVSIWYNDSGLDPDEYLKKYGTEKMKQGIDNRISWLDFIMSYAVGQYGTESFENKKRIVSFMIPYLSNQDELTVSYYVNQLAERTGFEKAVLFGQIDDRKIRDVKPKQKDFSQVQTFRNQFKISHPEVEILKQMLLSKEAAYIYRDQLGFLPTKQAYDFALLLLDVYRHSEKVEIADLLSMNIDNDLQNLIIDFESRLGLADFDREVLMESIALILRKVENQNVKLKRKKMGETSDFDEKMKLLEEVMKTKRKNTGGK